jgi:hypothetical protein
MKLNKQELNILIDLLGENTRLTLSDEDRDNYYALRVRLEDYLAKITR